MRPAGRLQVLLLVGLAGCCAKRFEGARVAVPTAPAAPAGATAEGGPSTLRVLTWNVWLMPGWTRASPDNGVRVKAIAEAIRPLDADVVCTQKLFDSGTRKYLMDALVESYPYQYGPANCDCSINLTSGVVVFSRLPLSDYHEIKFKRSAGSEKLSNKGAMLLKGKAGGHPFQVVAAHLQGDDVAEYVQAMQDIRDAQMDQINDELIKPYADPDVPLILCGDLNTPRYGDWRKRDPNNLVDGPQYKRMVELFGVENGPEFRITLDASREHNDIADDNTGRTEEFDYVLLRKGKADVSGTWERLILRHPGWAGGDDKRQDLSYRWSTKATFTFR